MKYLIFRIGKNNLNQPAMDEMVLGFVEASRKEEAEANARENKNWTFFSDQKCVAHDETTVEPRLWKIMSAHC